MTKADCLKIKLVWLRLTRVFHWQKLAMWVKISWMLTSFETAEGVTTDEKFMSENGAVSFKPSSMEPANNLNLLTHSCSRSWSIFRIINIWWDGTESKVSTQKMMAIFPMHNICTYLLQIPLLKTRFTIRNTQPSYQDPPVVHMLLRYSRWIIIKKQSQMQQIPKTPW